MTHGTEPRGAHEAGEHTAPRRPLLGEAGRWRLVTPVAFGLCGVLFVTSAVKSEGNDLRPGRYTDLASLVSTESAQVTRLKDRVAALNAEVERLTESVDDRRVSRLKDKAISLRGPAGFDPVSGPGITITLSDAPEDVINASTQDLSLLVVHQQDIQAVVNAMWRGGALAVSVQGQRIVTTTGIKCEGNAVQLDGVPYSQPYVISAVGDQAALLGAIEEDEALQTYRQQADRPDIQVGWDMDASAEMTIPGYTGLTSLSYAKPRRG